MTTIYDVPLPGQLPSPSETASPVAPASPAASDPAALPDDLLESLSSSDTSDWSSEHGGTDVASEDDLDQAVREYDMLASQDWGRSRSDSSLVSSGRESSNGEGEESGAPTSDRMRLSFPDPMSLVEGVPVEQSSEGVAHDDAGEDDGTYPFILDARQPPKEPLEESQVTKENQEDEDADAVVESTPLSSRLVERDLPKPAVRVATPRDNYISEWVQTTGDAAGGTPSLVSSTPTVKKDVPEVLLTPLAPAVVFDELSSRASTSTPPPLLSEVSTRTSTSELFSPLPGSGEATPLRNLRTRPPSAQSSFATEKQATLESAQSLQSKLEELASTGKRSSVVSRRLLLLLTATVALATASSLLDIPHSGLLFAKLDLASTPAEPIFASTSTLPYVEHVAHSPIGPIRVYQASPAASKIKPASIVPASLPAEMSLAACPMSCGLSVLDTRNSLILSHNGGLKRSLSLFRGPTNDSTEKSVKPEDDGRSPRQKRKDERKKKRRASRVAATRRPSKKARRKAAVATAAQRCFHRDMPKGNRSNHHQHHHHDFSDALTLLSDAARTHLSRAERGAARLVDAAEKLSTRLQLEGARLQTEGTRTARALLETSQERALVDFQQAQQWGREFRQSLRAKTHPVLRRARRGLAHLRRGEVGLSMTHPMIYPKRCSDLHGEVHREACARSRLRQ